MKKSQETFPVTVRPIIMQPPKQRHENKSYHQILERFLGPFGLIFTISMAMKSAYFLTQNALDYTKLPPPLPLIVTIFTGIALAASAEVVGIAAGNKAYRLYKSQFDVESNRKLAKPQREAQARQIKFDSVINFVAAIFGFAVSTWALLAFAVAHANTNASSLAYEIMSAVTLQFIAVYIGVLFEPTRNDPFKDVVIQAYSAVSTTVSGIAARMQNNEATNNEIRLIQNVLPAHERGYLDALLINDNSTELWDSTRIAYFLMDHAQWSKEHREEQFASIQHNVTNRLRRTQNDSEYNITPKSKGRGLEIPADKALYLFLAEIQSATSNGILFANHRKIKTFQPAPSQLRKGNITENEQTYHSNKTDETALELVVL